ncbi:MAG: dephospho-CoA kinase [Chloroflexota bacterium]|nr:dephospho-CoA kinase [Chloroflexota bacterium]
MTKAPLVIGLTGNIGTGKSTVAAMLADLGAFVIDADREAHLAMAPGQPAYHKVVEEFGQEMAPQGGPIDRQALGQIVFSDPGALQRLEAIMHPAVFERTQQLVAASPSPVVVIEAIKLLEAGMSVRLSDTIWVVTASRENQLRRLVTRRGLHEAEALQRIDAQAPQAEKIALADVVIENNGSFANVRAQVNQAWNNLLATAGPALRIDIEGPVENR